MQKSHRSITNIAEPLIQSKPFRRLYNVTFLGILSPRFSRLPDHPLSSKKQSSTQPIKDDESRAHHSLGVAKIVLRFCELFSLTEQTRKYAAAWALLHDIATWPLSHTSEAAFSSITGLSHKALRRKMVIGDASLSKEYWLENAIREMGVNPNVVVVLFDKNDKPNDSRLDLLHSFIHSAITPDTLEGICRSRRALGIDVSSPNDVLASFERDLLDTMIVREHSKPVLKFMREKKEVYEKYINSQSAIKYESRWMDAIKILYESISLTESLELMEDEVVEKVCQSGLPEFRAIGRYKAPQRYVIDRTLNKKRMLLGDLKLEDLDEIFHSERK
ncbi:MAG: HD domain-containing protein [Rhodospirillales bacterium]|nr:HD domain-containing protein [Rhodospirillales bacterium]